MFSFWKRQSSESPVPNPVPAPLAPIGVVQSSLRQQGRPFDAEQEAVLVLRGDLASSVVGLDAFEYITVVFWMHQVAEAGRSLQQLRPGGLAAMPLVGVFATRTQNRPNPIGVTTVKLVSVSGTTVRVRGLDAMDGSPVLDVRPYLPPYDAFPDAAMPPWVFGAAPARKTRSGRRGAS